MTLSSQVDRVTAMRFGSLNERQLDKAPNKNVSISSNETKNRMQLSLVFDTVSVPTFFIHVVWSNYLF